MKKPIILLSIFLGIYFFVSIFVGFFLPLPHEIPEKLVFNYKLLSGFEFFFKYIPGILMTAFVVSLAVEFGRNSEGSSERYSKAMFGRFKNVMIISIGISLILTFSNEFGEVYLKNKKNSIKNQSKLIEDYVFVGRKLLQNGFSERAMRYAQEALKLDEENQEAMLLKENCDEEISLKQNSNVKLKIYEFIEETEKVDRVLIDVNQISEVYSLYQKAQKSYENQEWFNAHFYAEEGIRLATAKDPNLANLKEISISAWNNLSQMHNLIQNEEQIAFNKKYEGYLALVKKDDLKAYYIFNDLLNSSIEFRSDPDVVFYYDIAKKRLNEKYFFIDETLEMETLEFAHNVKFACDYGDGGKDIFYFKGVTTVDETGNSIQYLRDLTVVSLDSKGNTEQIMSVPYAKVLPISTQDLNKNLKSLLKIDEKVQTIPYIMLKSIDRNDENINYQPKYKFQTNSPDYLLLPLSYDDLLTLENISENPNISSLSVLISLSKNADIFGYSSVIFRQVLMNRLFYPLLVMIIFMILATFTWNNRIGVNQVFKFSWLFAIPTFVFAGNFFYKIFIFCFKLINYAILARFNFIPSLFFGLFVYFIFFVASSIFLLARRSSF